MQPHSDSDYFVSDRNLTIARDLLYRQVEGLSSPAYEWVVVISFYSTVRCLNTWIKEKQGTPPINHGQRFRYIRGDPALRELLDGYSMLRSWSEEARYTSPPSAFTLLHAERSIEIASDILGHIHSKRNPE